MRVWTVHEPRDLASAEERADKTVFLKDGFSWPGLLISLPWLLYRRLWLGTLIYVLISAGAGLAGTFLPLTEDAGFVLGLIGSLYAGFEGNDLRRRKLARLGYAEVASVAAKNATEAELIYFAERTDTVPPSASATAPRGIHPAPVFNEDALGFFPQPGAPR